MYLRHPVHITQSIAFNMNVFNAKFNFQVSYILSIRSLAGKPATLLQVSVDELLFNPNSKLAYLVLQLKRVFYIM